MKRLILAVLAIIIVIPHYGWADTEVTIKEAGLVFSLPDTWDTKVIRENQSPPKMDLTDPLMMRWKRSAIMDKSGNKVWPGLNISVLTISRDANLPFYSNGLMQRRKWPVKDSLTAGRDGLMLPNSRGYLTQYSPKEGLVMKVFVVHAINNGIFTEFTLSATEEMFPKVESEFRAILKSLRLTGGPAENNVSTDGATLNYHRVTIPEIGISINLPQRWPKKFRISGGSPSSMPFDSPYIINMRSNDGTGPGTFSIINILIHEFTKADRWGSLLRNGKNLGAQIYSLYLQMPDRENIEFRELDDAANARLQGKTMSKNKGGTPLPNIHIPNSAGYVGARKINDVPYTTYEICALNKGKMAYIVIAVPTSSFSDHKPEMEEIIQRMTYE